jgi:hypothetical protein
MKIYNLFYPFLSFLKEDDKQDLICSEKELNNALRSYYKTK